MHLKHEIRKKSVKKMLPMLLIGNYNLSTYMNYVLNLAIISKR